jgi:HD-GYP domain-containing protein (c-di-GMP phosphodiesterase class II)
VQGGQFDIYVMNADGSGLRQLTRASGEDNWPEWSPAAKLVRSTHERLDGSGYPDGLAADQIPLGARVIAVCDVFAAMTSPRTYGPQLNVSQALTELRQGAGSQFDPKVVDALSELAVELIWPTKPADDPDKIQASHHPA